MPKKKIMAKKSIKARSTKATRARLFKEIVKAASENKGARAVNFKQTRNGRGSFPVYRSARKTIQNENYSVSRETQDFELLHGTLQELRLLSRQLIKDTFIGEGVVTTFQEMAVGAGPRVQSKEKDEEARKQMQAIIDESMEAVDITGEKTLPQFLKNVVGNVCASGDVLNIRRTDTRRKGLQTVMELIEADRVDTPHGKSSVDNVRHGVEYLESGRIKGYWVQNLGKTDLSHRYGIQSGSDSNFRFFPKTTNGFWTSVLLKRPEGIERPGQSRQVPLLTSCLTLIQDADQLFEATVIGQKARACIMASIESQNPEGIVEAITTDEEDQTENTDLNGVPYTKLQPAGILPLRPGEKMNLHDPKGSGGEAEPMLLRIMKSIGMKVRVPYPILFLDLKEINFSSYRGGILESRKMFGSYRDWLDREVIRRFMVARITEAFLKGMLPAVKSLDDVDIIPRVIWPAWGFIDPSKEIKANAEAIATGQTSHIRVIGELGMDHIEVLEEEAAYEKKKAEIFKKAGVAPPAPPAAQGPGRPPEDKEDDDETEDEDA